MASQSLFANVQSGRIRWKILVIALYPTCIVTFEDFALISLFHLQILSALIDQSAATDREEKKKNFFVKSQEKKSAN